MSLGLPAGEQAAGPRPHPSLSRTLLPFPAPMAEAKAEATVSCSLLAAQERCPGRGPSRLRPSSPCPLGDLGQLRNLSGAFKT